MNNVTAGTILTVYVYVTAFVVYEDRHMPRWRVGRFLGGLFLIIGVGAIIGNLT